MGIFNKFRQLTYKDYEAQHPKLHSLLPYRLYDATQDLYVNEHSYGFMLEVTPLCGADEKIVNILTGMLTDGVPEGVSIQIINWTSPNIDANLNTWQEARSNGSDIYKFLAQKRREHFQNKNWHSFFNTPLLLKNFRIYIAVAIPFTFGEKGRLAITSLKSQLIATLKSAGMQAIQMKPEEFLHVLSTWVNPKIKSNAIDVKWNPYDLIRESLSDTEQKVFVTPSGLILQNPQQEDLEIRSFTVQHFPEVWAQWLNRDLLGDFFSDYLRLPCPVLTVFSFVYGNEESARNKANYKAIRSLQQMESGIGKFMPSVASIAKDWRFASDKLKKGQKLVKAFYQVTMYAKRSQVEEYERYIRSLYQSKEWRLARDEMVQLQTWLAAMPFTLAEGLDYDLTVLGRMKSMVSWSCANLAPLQGEWRGCSVPGMLLVGRLGQLQYFDPFDNKGGNYNVAVIGESGSGKSVFMQELVCSMLGRDGQVIVIDDGRSFMNSCQMQGGTFIDFSGSESLCLNPFSIVSEQDFEERPDYKEEVIHLLNLMIRQMCRFSENTSDIENAYIQEAIFYVWDQYKSQASVSHIAAYLSSHKDPRATDLGLMLAPFTSVGLYGRFFEGQANISLNNNFFVFEFDKIKSKPDLQRIVLMIVIFLVSEKMFHGDRMRTISLVIDEAWSLLSGNQFSEFIEGIARRARKYRGNLITGTQSIDDYYENPAGIAAIQNTNWFCLLKQKKESIKSIKKSDRIAIDDAMEKALNSLITVNNQYSEVMICNPATGWSVSRLILDPYSSALYSSKGEEFAKIQKLQHEGMSLMQAVEIVANDIARTK